MTWTFLILALVALAFLLVMLAPIGRLVTLTEELLVELRARRTTRSTRREF